MFLQDPVDLEWANVCMIGDMDDQTPPPLGARSRTHTLLVEKIARDIEAQVEGTIVTLHLLPDPPPGPTLDPPSSPSAAHILDIRLDDRRWTLTCRTAHPQIPGGVEIGISIGGADITPSEDHDIYLRDPALAVRVLRVLIRP
jgi:hypothetical protein